MLKSLWRVLRDAVDSFNRHGGTLLGGATAFFALLSAAPLLLVILWVAVPLAGEKMARAELYRSMFLWFGADGARTLLGLADASQTSHARGALAGVISALVLVYGATNLFLQMQQALNQIWNIRPKTGIPLKASARSVVQRHLLAFAMVLCCILSLLASLIVRTAFAVFKNLFDGTIPLGWHLIDHAVSLVGLIGMIATLFRVLPDARLAWKDAWVGAITTAVLFDIGREALALYLGRESRLESFGAAGSVVFLLLWVHYSAQIFYFGAALTASWASWRGRPIQPTENAVIVAPPE